MDFLGHPKALARLWACLMSDYEVVISSFIRSNGWTFSHFAESAKNMEISLVFHAAVGKGKRRQDQYDEVVQVILETAKDFWLTNKPKFKIQDEEEQGVAAGSGASAAGKADETRKMKQQKKQEQEAEQQTEPLMEMGMDVDVQEEEVDYVDKEMADIHGEPDETATFVERVDVQDEEHIEIVDLEGDGDNCMTVNVIPEVVMDVGQSFDSSQYPNFEMTDDEDVQYPEGSSWMFAENPALSFDEVLREGGNANNYGDANVELDDELAYLEVEERLASQPDQGSVHGELDLDHENEQVVDGMNDLQIEKATENAEGMSAPAAPKLSSGDLVLVKRQLGGFYLTYLLYFKQPYKGLHRITLDPEDYEALRVLDKKIKSLTTKIQLQYDFLMFRMQLNKAFDIVPFADRFGLDHSTRTYLNARKSELITLIKEDKDIQDRLTQCQDVQSGQKKYQRYFEQKRLVLNESLFSVLKVACPPDQVPADLKDDTTDVCKLVPNMRSTEAVGVMVEAAKEIKKLGQQPLFTHANLLGNEAVDRIFISEACKRLKRAQAKQEKGKGDKTKKTSNPYVREGGIFGRKKEVEEGDPELRRKKERAQTSGNLWNYIGGLEFTRGRPPVPPPPDPTVPVPSTSAAATAAADAAAASSAPETAAVVTDGADKEVPDADKEKEIEAAKEKEIAEANAKAKEVEVAAAKEKEAVAIVADAIKKMGAAKSGKMVVVAVADEDEKVDAAEASKKTAGGKKKVTATPNRKKATAAGASKEKVVVKMEVVEPEVGPSGALLVPNAEIKEKSSPRKRASAARKSIKKETV